jgi:hypothetical protein
MEKICLYDLSERCGHWAFMCMHKLSTASIIAKNVLKQPGPLTILEWILNSSLGPVVTILQGPHVDVCISGCIQGTGTQYRYQSKKLGGYFNFGNGKVEPIFHSELWRISHHEQIPIFHIALEMWHQAGHSCSIDIFLVL